MTVLKAVKQLNPKVIQLSILFYFGLLIPVSFAHELGHAAICNNSAGHDSSIHLDFRGMYTECTPDLETTWFYLAGPFAGTSISATVLIVGLWIREASGDWWIIIGTALLVAGIAFTADQLSKIPLEGFMTRLYQAGVFDVAITAFQILSLLAAILIFARPTIVAKKAVKLH